MLPLAKKTRTGEIKLILASGSARRRLLFETAGFEFECITSNFPEDLDKSQFEGTLDYVRATCLGKLVALPVPESSNTIQVACDTVVVRPDGIILEKPASEEEAFLMIKSLLGKRIKVISVVHLRRSGRIEGFHEESELVMRSGEGEISDEDIYGYLSDVNYKDLAGGLAVQSSGMIFVKEISGCYHNVMGFPMSTFYQKLNKFINE